VETRAEGRRYDGGIHGRLGRLRPRRIVIAAFRTIRSRLYLVVGVAAAAFVALAVHAASAAWRARRDAELVANLEVARTVASALRLYAEGVLREAGALGRTLATERVTKDEASRLLAGAVSDDPAVREFSWVALDGRIAASSNPSAIGVSIADRDYYARILAGEDRAVSNLLVARVDGRAAVVVARAVRRPGGTLAGTMIAVIAPDRLNLRALPLAREGNAAITIIDRAGRIVFRTPELELEWDARLVGPSQPIVAEALAGREATGEVRGETGDVRLGAAVPIPQLGWAARASRSADETMGPLRRELAVVLAAGVLVSLLAVAAASVVGTGTVTALWRLERHANALGRGERPRRPLRGPVEIARLGRAYERLAAGLGAAQHRFRAAFDAAPVGILVLDPADLAVRWANRAAHALVDEPFRSEGLVNRRFGDVVPAAAAGGLVEVLRRVREGDGPHEATEARLDGLARGPTWWSWSVRTIPAEGGGEELLLLATDVTEQVRAREQIEAARRRLECILETLPAGVIIADASGLLVQANDEARRIWGGRAPLGDPRGHRAYRARLVETGAPLEPRDWPTQRALATGKPVAPQLVEIERLDGGRTTILTGGQPILDAAGRAVGSVATALDVTELRCAVRHRDDVMQIVSHDLRTPLATITLGAAALARLPDGPGAAPQARRAAARISSAGKRMARLIEDLLDLASLDEGRLSIRPGRCDPADLLAAAAEEVAEAAREKGLDLCLSVAPGLPEVSADRDRILQVLGNVASNAVKATESGAVCLAAEAAGDAVVFRVRDTGPGIPPEELPHVFDRFHRGADAAYRGTGLGLAIARALVEAHGGAIRAESPDGEGTTVSFTLPAVLAAEDAEDRRGAVQGGAADGVAAA
jgi:signal transduction histidine kinase